MTQESISYNYQALEHSQNQIRLVHLLPGLEAAILECEFEIVDIRDSPCYAALSYEWGDSSRQVFNIKIGDSLLSIRENLWQALHQLRSEETSQVLWIDALCINQMNIQERNHQVGLMKSIYSHAERVIAWVGLQQKDISETAKYPDNTAAAFRFLQEFQNRSLEDCPYQMRSENGSGRFELTRHAAKWDALTKLWKRKYWSRLWIVQEVVLATQLYVVCGPWTIPWPWIAHVCQELQMDASFSPFIENLTSTFVYRISQRRLEHIESLNTTSDNSALLMQLLAEFEDSDCFDIRDKIFGIQSLCKKCCRDAVPVDYSLEIIAVCAKLLEHHLLEHSPPKGRQTKNVTQSVMRALGLEIPKDRPQTSFPWCNMILPTSTTPIKVPLSTEDGGNIVYLSTSQDESKSLSLGTIEGEDITAPTYSQDTSVKSLLSYLMFLKGRYHYFNPSYPRLFNVEEEKYDDSSDTNQPPVFDRDTLLTSTWIAQWQHVAQTHSSVLDEMGIQLFITSTGRVGCVTKSAKLGDRVCSIDGRQGRLVTVCGEGVPSVGTGKGLELAKSHFPMHIEPPDQISLSRIVTLRVDVATLMYLCGPF